MNISQIIAGLKTSSLHATCDCGGEFKLSDAVLFDGLGKFPKGALDIQARWLDEYKRGLEELRKRKISAEKGAEQKAIDIGVGKIIEKILPAAKNFSLPLPDCRPLFEPIDLLVFEGAAAGKVSNITFLEIKSGKSALNAHQRMIRDAIKANEVSFKVI